MLNVESLMEAAYPHCAKNKALRATLAQNYIWRVLEKREQRTRQRAEDKKLKKVVKDGEDT